MSVINFIPAGTKNCEEVRAAIERTVSGEDTEICLTVSALTERIRSPVDAGSVAVLLPATPEDLAGLIKISEFLDDLRIILVLPEAGNAVVDQGHRLRPRVLLQGDDYLERLLAVLGNMIRGPRRPVDRAEGV